MLVNHYVSILFRDGAARAKKKKKKRQQACETQVILTDRKQLFAHSWIFVAAKHCGALNYSTSMA